ncbi:APC family permease [Haliangium sp. UPWRP_2]|uniref:APC family permease n=1 Tax=Haliangium sp. UPWRP_2 TaxID=1931276 RepID=UPI000B545D94|nr:APC family permease [Haliangium sp. UPWRP_2]PSM32286.1 APC family permease [Haliangium sp. UPWRP_2]
MKQVASAVVQRRRLLPSGTAKQIGASKKRASINPPSTPTLATLVETSDKPGSTEHFPSLTDAISRPNSSPTAATLAPAKPLGLLSLVATLFFVVSGGPYGLEEIVSGHGYLNTLILLLVVPLIWSVPSALMVGELASALPHEGGYYTWVRRALGPFWGMQEAWLMVAFSLFDMAIYPTLLVTYLGRIFPVLRDTGVGGTGWLAGVAMVVVCVLWNLRGSRAVGSGSIGLGALLLFPFVVVSICGALALRHSGFDQFVATLTAAPATTPSSPESGPLWVTGILLCMWNYLGWDSASTVAGEVDKPQRNYPRALFIAVILVAACYTIPVLFAAGSGLPAEAWTTGSWVEIGRRLGGPWVGVAIALGGAMCGIGMFNALVLSHSRLPLAMVRDGLLPTWLGKRSARTGAPTRVLFIAAALYIACMGLGFRRLVQIDVILYGGAMLLQFVALIVLRVREPSLPRPFRIPGGVLGLLGLAALPMGLLTLALWFGRAGGTQGMWGLGAMQTGLAIAAVGPVLYAVQRLWRFLSVAGNLSRSSIAGLSDELGELPPPQNLHHHAATAATAAAVSSSVIAGLH